MYKRNRKEIMRSSPIYPTGVHPVNAKELCTFGLLTDKKLFLAVWNLSGAGIAGQRIDLASWVKAGSKVARRFPERKDIRQRLGEGGLEIMALEEGAAFFLEIWL